MVRQVECMEVDINAGFKNTVTMAVNEQLINMQEKGCSIISISQPLVDGRKVYLTIEYDDPTIEINVDVKKEPEKDGPVE